MTENKTQTPRPPITKEEFHPPWIYPEEYKEKELSTEQNPITTTVSSGDTSVVFEKPGTGSMMAVSVIPNIDQSKKTVKVIYDDELVRKKAKIFLKEK